MKIGEIVSSTAGRDNGRFYVVIAIDGEDRVKVSDGEKRSMKNAKLKNTKHLNATGHILDKIAQKLIAGEQVFDTELRSALRSYNEGAKN